MLEIAIIRKQILIREIIKQGEEVIKIQEK